MINVISISGINDGNMIMVVHNKGTLEHSKFRIEGNGTFLDTLNNKEIAVSPLILGGKQYEINLNIPKSTVLYNNISIAEGHTQSLNQFIKIVNKIGNPIINHPQNLFLTLRDKIQKTLSGIEGVVVPKCLKIAPSSTRKVAEFIARKRLDFPFLFRPVLEHNNEQRLVKIDTLDDLEKLECFAFDGIQEYYVIQFVNFVTEDGLYRKIRYLIVGNEIFPRHLMLSKSWQIHTDDKRMDKRIRKKQIAEEINLMSHIELSIGQRLLAIKEALGLDYFGVDCAMDQEGRIVIFEANPYSMIGIGKNDTHHHRMIESIYKALKQLIEEKALSIHPKQ